MPASFFDRRPLAVSTGGRQLLDLVFKTGGISQAALTRQLGLAQPTVARLLHGFVDAGLIRLDARKVDRPGHPSATARIVPDFAFSLGAAVLGDAVSLVLLDGAGGLVASQRAVLTEPSRAAVTSVLLRFRDELFAQNAVDPARVLGLGVGMSAFFTGEGGQMAGPPALDDWTGCEPAAVLEEALGLPVVVENDGSAGAIGESLFGIGRTIDNFAYLHLTNGFGGGIISNGRLFRGARGNAGEFGGIWTIGQMGYPSLYRLLSLVNAAGGAFSSVEEMLRAITPAIPGVEAWLDEATPAFSTLAAMLSYAIDPAAIVIGGRLPPAIADQLVERIAIPRAPNRHGMAPPVPRILRSEIVDDSVALGAGVIPIQRAFLA